MTEHDDNATTLSLLGCACVMLFILFWLWAV